MFLPPELYRPIIQYVKARPDLFRLLSVSRLTSYEAERFLYHAIHITPTYQSLMALLLRLAHCQRVACLVRELGVYGGITLAKTGIPSHRQIWSSVNQALCMLTNLQVLNLSITITAPADKPCLGVYYLGIPQNIFFNCAFTLETLILKGYTDRKPPRLNLTQVKELGLINTLRVIDGFLPDTLISLRIMTSSLSQFINLGADNFHRVKALCIDDIDLVYAAQFPSITSLKFYFWEGRDFTLFPSLRYIYVAMGRNMNNINAYLPSLVDELSNSECLEKLCLDGDVYPANVHVKLFSGIPSLQELDIVSGLREVKRWNRNGMDSVDVPGALIENEWKDPRWL